MSLYDKRGQNYYNDPYERAQNKRKFALFLRSVMAGDEQTIDWNTDARMLFDVIRKGKLHMIRFILEAAPGDLANSIDIKGKTPLMVSCTIKEELRRSMTVRLLISCGADVNIEDDDGRTVLSHACETRCNDVVDMLVRHHNIDPDIPDKNGNTALMYSAVVGNDVATDILLRHFRRLGLNIDRQNGEGFTALLLSAKYGNITCAKMLIEQGHASLRHRDRIHGWSTEEWLKKNGFTLEDVTPLTMRLKQKAMYMRAINSRCYNIPNEQERDLYETFDDDDDDDDIQSFGCFNVRRPYQTKRLIDLAQLDGSSISEIGASYQTELGPSYQRPKDFSRQRNTNDNLFGEKQKSRSPFPKTDSMSTSVSNMSNKDIQLDEDKFKLPDIKVPKSSTTPVQRQNILNCDLKTRCPEKVPDSTSLPRSRSTHEFGRWQSPYYGLQSQKSVDDVSYGNDSGMHEMLE